MPFSYNGAKPVPRGYRSLRVASTARRVHRQGQGTPLRLFLFRRVRHLRQPRRGSPKGDDKEKKDLVVEAAKDALHKIQLYQKENEKRLDYPDIFLIKEHTPITDLRWNTVKFTKRDLIELLAALDEVEAIVDPDGTPTSFIHLTKAVGELLDISLEYAYKERTQIQNRAKNVTPFLTIIKNALGD